MPGGSTLRQAASRESLRSPARRLLQRQSIRSSLSAGGEEGNASNAAQHDQYNEEQFMDDDEDDEIARLESNIIQKSRTIDDFTRIIAEWRTERERAADGAQSHSTTAAANSVNNKRSTHSLSAANLLAVDGSSRVHKQIDADAASTYSYDPSSVGDFEEEDGSRIASSQQSVAGPSNAGTSTPLLGRARCTCCCGRGPRKCRRARRAAREWADIENDLQLAAQIGQALLRRTDALQAELSSRDDEGSSRLDSVMKRLTASIKSVAHLEKRLEQSDLNLEAADASNRALVRELDETRQELQRLCLAQAHSSTVEARLQSNEQELQDLKQELAHERRRHEQTSALLKRTEKVNTDLGADLKIAKTQSSSSPMTDDDRAKRRDEFRQLIDEKLARQDLGTSQSNNLDSIANSAIDRLVKENEAMQADVAEMRRLLEERNDEIAHLREEVHHRELRSTDPGDTSLNTTVSESSAVGMAAHVANAEKQKLSSLLESELDSSQATLQINADKGEKLARKDEYRANTMEESISGTGTSSTSDATKSTSITSQPKRETRTNQLNVLIDYVHRIFTRLSSADVDTLARRLQRQKLTGDVGHLARSTVSGIVRDADGLREHFRRAMESESKGRDSDGASMSSSRNASAESESLVARKELFLLIKVFKDIFYEMARLRNAINEVTLQPHLAAKILQEHLGVQANEEKSVGAWIGRLFSTPTSNPSQSLSASSGASSALNKLAGGQHRLAPADRRVSSQLMAPSRASAAAVPSAVAVEVKLGGQNATGSFSNADTDSNGPSPQIGSFGSSNVAAPSPDLSSSALPQFPRPRDNYVARKQSRNLSGLFIGASNSETSGAALPSFQHALSANDRQKRLSRVVDDDELSSHQAHLTRARALRPRNLSDSSIHTTFLNDAENEEESTSVSRKPLGIPSAPRSGHAASRIITSNSLSLRVDTSTEEKASALSSNIGSAFAMPGILSGGVAKAFGYLSSSAVSSSDVDSPATTAAAADKENATLVSHDLDPTTSASSVMAKKTLPGSAPNSALLVPHAPRLRSKSSKAELSMAAASMDRADRIFSGSGAQR